MGFTLLTTDFTQDKGKWVGICLELGTATQADSLDAVQNELHELIDLQLNGMVELGYNEEYLAIQGIRLHPVPSIPQTTKGSGTPRKADRWDLVSAGA